MPMSIGTLLTTHPLLPWRLRNAFELWLETRCRQERPSAYRWLHFGRAGDPLRPVTRGPHHHFFGYYEKCPWNLSGRLLLAHESEFNDRPPRAGDRAGIGVVRLDDGGRVDILAQSTAWNWQQGAMLQWHPSDPEEMLVHNDCRDGQARGIVRRADGTELAVHERPIYALTPDGRHAYSLNFGRLQTHRPGYGYAGVEDPWAADPAPAGDGIHRVDLQRDTSELIVPLARLAAMSPVASMDGAVHYVNHVQVSPGGRRFAFFHIWTRGAGTWSVRLYTAAADGSDLRCMLDTGRVSHYDWLDDRQLLVWAKPPTGGADRFLLCRVDEPQVTVFSGQLLTEDGHCTFSPDRAWVLNDTYPDRHDMRTLMLVHWPDGRRVDLARLHSPKSRWWGEIRCDLHPRWSRDGRQVCVDSVHDGTRQIYVVDVQRWTT